MSLKKFPRKIRTYGLATLLSLSGCAYYTGRYEDVKRDVTISDKSVLLTERAKREYKPWSLLDIVAKPAMLALEPLVLLYTPIGLLSNSEREVTIRDLKDYFRNINIIQAQYGKSRIEEEHSVISKIELEASTELVNTLRQIENDKRIFSSLREELKCLLVYAHEKSKSKQIAILKKGEITTEFCIGAIMPINKNEYLRFFDDNLNLTMLWPIDGKFEGIGQLLTTPQTHEPTVLPLPYKGNTFFALSDQEYQTTNNFFHVSYNNGQITTTPYRNEGGVEVVMLRLPNSAIIKKHLDVVLSKVNEIKEESAKIRVTYLNPKISLPLGQGKYIIIPKDAKWDSLVSFARVGESGIVEILALERLREEIIKGAKIYPLPKDSYMEDRSNLEIRLVQAIEFERTGRYEEALNIYEDLKNNNNAIVLHNAGTLHLKKGNTNEGIRNLEEVFEKDPDYELSLRAHINLGNAYIRNRMIQKAEDEFKKALEICPGHTDAIYCLGALEFNEKKNYEEAVRYWEIIKRIDENYPEINNNIRIAQERKDEALQTKIETLLFGRRRTPVSTSFSITR